MSGLGRELMAGIAVINCRALGIFIMAAGFALLLPPVISSAADLEQCYRAALATDPVLAEAEARFSAVKAAKPLAMSRLLPNLEAGASVSESNVYLKGLGPIVDDTYTVSSYSVTLSQAVIDIEAWSALKAADQEIKAAAASVIAARQDLLYRLVDTYLGVLRARADLKVAESNEKLLESARKQASAFLEHGTGDIVAVQEAEARLDLARAAIIKARNRVEVSRRDLERITHEKIDYVPDFRQFEPTGPNPDNIDQWVETALEKQPLVRQASLHLEAAEQEVQRTRHAHLPKLHIVAGNSYGMRVMRPEIRNRVWEAGFQLSVPLYLGGRLFADTEKAVSMSEVNRQQLNSVKDQTKFETQAAFLGLRDSVAALNAAEQSVRSAQTSLESTKKGYEVGTRTMVDVLDRIRDLQQARRECNLARYYHILARIRLKRASGTVSDQDIASLNTLLQAGKPVKGSGK